MQGVYKKGRKAFSDGLDITQCPYKDRRKADGRLSWSRAFIRVWQDGWRDEKLEMEQKQ